MIEAERICYFGQVDYSSSSGRDGDDEIRREMGVFAEEYAKVACAEFDLLLEMDFACPQQWVCFHCLILSRMTCLQVRIDILTREEWPFDLHVDG